MVHPNSSRGLCEVLFATCLGKAKESTETTAWLWYVGFVVFMVLSMYLLIKAIAHLPIGTAYVVWTGIGAAGTALVGIFLFKEPLEF